MFYLIFVSQTIKSDLTVQNSSEGGDGGGGGGGGGGRGLPYRRDGKIIKKPKSF